MSAFVHDITSLKCYIYLVFMFITAIGTFISLLHYYPLEQSPKSTSLFGKMNVQLAKGEQALVRLRRIEHRTLNIE